VLPKHTRREGTRAAGFVAWFNSAAWQATAFGAVAHRATVESGFTTGSLALLLLRLKQPVAIATSVGTAPRLRRSAEPIRWYFLDRRPFARL